VVRLPNWLGDIVMALPALRAIRARWPGAHLAVALPRAYASLADAISGVDETLPLTAGRSWRDRAAFAADTDALRAGAFDTALLLTNSFASALMARRAGIRERWGYRSDLRGPLLTIAVAKTSPRELADRHHARYYLRLVEALGCGAAGLDASIAVPAAWRERAARLLEQRGVAPGALAVGVAPGAAYGAAKQWPTPLVADVIQRGVRERGWTCVLVGTPADTATGRTLVRQLAARGVGAPAAHVAREGRRTDLGTGIVNLIGETDLPTLAGLMTHCAAFLCNDSGAMHLAAAAGVHVVVPFGATDEHATHPLGPHAVLTGEAWCRPCLRRECPIDHRCMWSIAPGRVYESLSLATGAARSPGPLA
jgi:heptosyltransferase-2